jgi:uncharacterized membrane protein
MMQHTVLVQPKYVRKWELNDTKTRSLVKTISWRFTGSFSTFMISYLVLGSFAVAGSIAIIQIVANTLLYFVHERVWNLIKWGKA